MTEQNFKAKDWTKYIDTIGRILRDNESPSKSFIIPKICWLDTPFLSVKVWFKVPCWKGSASWRVCLYYFSQFSSVTHLCPILCDPMNHSTPGLPVHHHLREFTQTHIHQVGDAIQPSHPLLSPSPPASNPSQYQSLFQWVNSSHGVAKVLEFQL